MIAGLVLLPLAVGVLAMVATTVDSCYDMSRAPPKTITYEKAFGLPATR